MSTLRHYFSSAAETAGFRHAVDVLLHGLTGNVVRVDDRDYDSFVESMKRITSTVPTGCSMDQMSIAAGSAVQTLDDYNARTSRAITERGALLQNMIEMLGHSLVAISGGSDAAMEAFNDLHRGLSVPAVTEDLYQLKSRLGECLRNLSESALQRNAGDLSSTEPPKLVSFGLGLASAAELSGRKAAETAIQQALATPGRKYLVTAVMDRLQSIRARFGRDIGNEALQTFAERIREKLEPRDRLYRWGGPALVAVLNRDESIENLRKTVKHVFAIPLDKEFDVGGREILIPISAAWSVIAMTPPATNLYSHVERFVASQSPHDYC